MINIFLMLYQNEFVVDIQHNFVHSIRDDQKYRIHIFHLLDHNEYLQGIINIYM
jgi:hypothetical protein